MYALSVLVASVLIGFFTMNKDGATVVEPKENLTQAYRQFAADFYQVNIINPETNRNQN